MNIFTEKNITSKEIWELLLELNIIEQKKLEINNIVSYNNPRIINGVYLIDVNKILAYFNDKSMLLLESIDHYFKMFLSVVTTDKNIDETVTDIMDFIKKDAFKISQSPLYFCDKNDECTEKYYIGYEWMNNRILEITFCINL